VAAFKTLKVDGRHNDILKLYKPDSKFTDRGIAVLLGFADINMVRPRLSELIDFGYLRECGKTKDMVTGRTVRLTTLNEAQGRMF
jgi:hypothetical protein